MKRREFLQTSTMLLAFGASLLQGVQGSSLSGDEVAKSIPKIKLNNGVFIPAFGYGTWNVTGEAGKEAIKLALSSGYRLIDSAALYKNEAEVGEVVRQSGIDRSEIFITTKIWGEADAKGTRAAFDESFKRLGVGAIDLYLLHWPSSDDITRYKELERILSEGKARAIGVSNLNTRALRSLMNGVLTTPAVNQIKINPFSKDWDTINFCRENDIVLEAYTPLGDIRRAMGEQRLTKIAMTHGKSVAQIMLRWSYQHGFIAIPKSSNLARMRENIDIFNFELDEKEMKIIDEI